MITNVETEKILTWLRREAKQNDGQALVTLTHMNVGGFGAPLGRWPIDESDADDVIARIAQELYAAACDDADGQSAPGPQQYVAHFFGEADLRNPISRLPFLCVAARQSQLGPQGEGFSTEPPTEKGFIGHVMRHSDTAWRHAWTVTGHALGMIERHASMVSQENSHLRQSNFDLARGYEGLLSERHIRELAAQNAIHERHERSQFWNRMWLLAPPVVGRLLGSSSPPRALPPGSPQAPLPSAPVAPPASPVAALPPAAGPASAPSPNEARPASAPAASDSVLAIQLRALFDSFSTEQLATLQSTLSAEQFIALGMLYQSLPQAPEVPEPVSAEPPAPPPVPEGAS